MSLNDDSLKALAAHLEPVFAASSITVAEYRKLSGGAIQENWSLDLEIFGGPRAGKLALVLRTDSPSSVAVSLSRSQEFALLEAAWKAGVTVPEPIYCCDDPGVLGKEFCLMRRIDGVAVGQRVVKDLTLGGPREELTEALGRELAKIHDITPATHSFAFLPAPSETPSHSELRRLRAHLDALGQPRPVMEWTLRWLELRAPEADKIVLAHRDFRTGNYMVDARGLTGILDWEFAGWSDPLEDIGWFCAMCWRFSARDKAAGGIGSREAFYRGYESQAGGRIDPARVYWWEVYAHLRWALIALQQAERYLSGGEKTLNLGLTGLRAPENEAEMLRMTAPDGTYAKEAR